MMNEYFQFLYPSWLYVLPILVVLAFLRKRKGSDGSIAHPTARFILSLARPASSLAGRIGALLTLLSIFALIIALARPQIVKEQEVQSISGIDILIAFDLSGSMNAPDMLLRGIRASRFHVAQEVIAHFIKTRPNDRIGLVGFAAKTKSICPLTLDHALLTEFIDSMYLGMIKTDGTAIGSAIAASASRLQEREETKSKIIILITDGASNSGQISPEEAAAAAAKLGIRIYTIAVGSDTNAQAGFGITLDDFDEETLKKIASITGGEHFRASDTNKLQLAFTSIDKLEKSDAKLYNIKREQEFFIYFLIAAFILMSLGLGLQILRPQPAP